MSERNVDDTRLLGRIARHVATARGLILVERVWRAIWPAQLVVGAFPALALLGVFGLLDPWAHAALLAIAALGVLVSIGLGLRRVAWPDAAAGEARVERASGLKHRPIATLRDRPALDSDDPAVIALWTAHRNRLAARLSRLRVGMLRAGIGERDPVALRAAVALLLVLGIGVAGDTSLARIAAAFKPGVALPREPAPVVDLWVEPPGYTGLAPVIARADRPMLTFPTGSTVVARVRGGKTAPSLAVDEQQHAFKAVDSAAFDVRAKVTAGTRLAVRRGKEELVGWPITVTPDAPPTASLPKPPSGTPRAVLRLEYAAEDDYGLKSLDAVLRRVDSVGDPVGNERLTLPIAIASEATRTAKGSEYRDLAPHEWAGRLVELVLVARDGADQEGISEPVRFTLPEREFTHPVARLIIEQRKKLGPSPLERREVASSLLQIADMVDFYDADTTVYLALMTARARLRVNLDPDVIPELRDLLWDTALRLEDGDISLAEREMRAAQQAVAEALARKAPQDEVDKLIARLQEAIQRFMQQMLADAEEIDPSEIPPDAQVMSSQDLQDLLEKLREALKAGRMDQAQQLMAQLQQMLEQMRNARAMRQQGGDGDQQTSEMMRQLQEMARRQREMLDRTFQQQQAQRGQRGQRGQQGQGQQGQPGQGQMPGMGELSAEQERLRRQLGEMMRQLAERGGQMPGQLGRAEQAMRDALNALERGQAGEALGPEAEALDQLQQAGRAMSRGDVRQLGQGDPSQLQQPGQNQQTQRDPLGRDASGGLSSDTNDVGIPGEGETQRARRIWDELQRRAGDRARPTFERDYLDRLLKTY